jgi:putative oxidoreductase
MFAGNNLRMNIDKTLRDVAVLGARLALGGTMAAHGAQKMFGAFDGPGPQGTAKMLHSLGFRPSDRFATMNAAAEMTAGGLIALGALGPVGPAMLTAVMIVAIETVHRPKGFFNSQGGYEMNVMYLTSALLLANHGYGSLSFDELVGLQKNMRPVYSWLAIAGAVAGAIGILSQRQTEPPATRIEMPSLEKTESPV